MTKEIKKDIYWIGEKDFDLQVFDIVMETEFGTTYNAYLIKGEDGHALVETVKIKFFEGYINKIKELVNIEDIKYLIVNHTEPDHAGSVGKILELNPNITVVGSKTALSYLTDIVNADFKKKPVTKNDTLSLGNKTLGFVAAPFLHWPDSMYTYLQEDHVLFTCDSFGSHFAFDGVLYSEIKAEEKANYEKALRYYYDAIFSPFKKFVLKAIEEIKNLQIDLIATGHGPIHDTEIAETIQTYKEWSTVIKPSGKSVVIPYASSYGYTGEMAEAIKEGIQSYCKDIDVKMHNIDVSNYYELKTQILEEIEFADAVLFGSSTINKDATPVIWDLATSLNPIVHQGKIASAFGSYGWTGEGVDFIQQRLDAMNLKTLPGLKLKFKPSTEQRAVLVEYGVEVAKAVMLGTINFEMSDVCGITFKK